MRLADRSVSGFEALLRWRHPVRGMIAPFEFIPLAEESGLIVPIGRWVLNEAVRHACALGGGLRMNVNVSTKQLQDATIVDDVRDALAASGFPPDQLVLELTESVLMEDTALAVERLRDLKDLGVRLALDDFGTGYSSLGYLSRFPVDVLKLDRSFLTQGDPALIAAVVVLGQGLALEVVAEGIEETEQWETLSSLGCEYGQGYLFARPMDAAASLAFRSSILVEAAQEVGDLAD